MVLPHIAFAEPISARARPLTYEYQTPVVSTYVARLRKPIIRMASQERGNIVSAEYFDWICVQDSPPEMRAVTLKFCRHFLK